MKVKINLRPGYSMRVLYIACFFSTISALQNSQAQTVVISGTAKGDRFDGMGAVSGGGATTVLLKDYPDVQRKQVLDLMFKPKFGASLSSLMVEVPGDGNSTQGSEPSHMHTRNDENYFRGYEWWLMKEAKMRNPAITLDANAWGAPRWVGNNNFWSQDMADYYVKWIKGLKNIHGLTLEAIGCRNEKGNSYDFAKLFRKTLNAQGLASVNLHAFDNWGRNKFDFVKVMQTDTALNNAIDIISAHTMTEIAASPDVIQAAKALNKPIWNSEEHIYKPGFDCAISIVKGFNENYIVSGVTKVMNWYLVGSTYAIEPYAETPPMIIAREPWGGHYYIREALWGYAHYGQFTAAGWEYIKDACGKLNKGGSYVTMKGPKGDYSVIIEAKGASEPQQLSFKVTDGLSNGSLCLWRSTPQLQFEKLSDITPINGAFDIRLDSGAIYSISTTRGQQKGSFTNVPAPKSFPFPYYETFDEYNNFKDWGYLPHYTADIDGTFELAQRPDKKGKCLRQVVAERPMSWAPGWQPYTILGDDNWKDYEISADVYLNQGDSAGVMGRVNHVGTGYGTIPKGYFLQIGSDGQCRLVVIRGKVEKRRLVGDAEQQALIKAGKDDSEGGEKILGVVKVASISPDSWHNLKLRFEGSAITAIVDGKPVLNVTDSLYSHGMAGMMALGGETKMSTPYFDNLLINAPGSKLPTPTVFSKDVKPMYK